MPRLLILTAAVVIGLAPGPAAAQSAQPTAKPDISLPEACKRAANAGHAQMMQPMKERMSQAMKDGMQEMRGQMSQTQKDLHEAMMQMHPPMMEGMMAKDADVSWICAMIPHHQGAIEMAQAGLKGADNAGSRKLAEDTIASNRKELEKLIAWVEKNAARESRNEATGAAPQQR